MVRTVRAALVAAMVVGSVLTTMPAGAATAKTWVVSPEQSIQATVNKAHPGDTILLTPGTFLQSVTVTTNGLRIVGSGSGSGGTVIAAPAQVPKGTCKKVSGGAGVCVLGQFDPQFNLTKRVTGVTVTGIRFVDWNTGLFAFGTKDLTIAGNAAFNSQEYGLARFDSIGGVVRDNTVIGGGEAGIYVGDSADAGAKIQHNTVSGTGFGIFVRHSSGVELKFNQAFGNCQGILVLDDGQPGEASNITITNNVLTSNNKLCPASQDAPAIQGGGIALVGATDSTVSWNIVRNNEGSEINSGGIVLLSSVAISNGVDPSNDEISDNSSYGNTPADISWDGKGSGNTFTDNHCDTSVPSGNC